MSTLTGKRVWITGASSGIGAALAAECRARGARLVLSARDADRLRSLAERLESPAAPDRSTPRQASAGPKDILALPLDVTSPGEIAAAVSRAANEAGPVDVLIHAAGISQRAPGVETDMSVVRRILETNFFGVVGLTHELLRSSAARGALHIVVITSAFGKFGGPGRSAYAASKHALHGYFDSLRTELPRDEVRITLAVPGAIATNISANALRGDGSPNAVQEEGIARGMSPERCARTIARAIEHDREELYVAADLRLRFAYLLKKLAPRILTRILSSARIT